MPHRFSRNDSNWIGKWCATLYWLQSFGADGPSSQHQISFCFPFDFAFSLNRQSFRQILFYDLLVLRMARKKCANACDIWNDYVHSSFYAQLNLPYFTSDESVCGTHCIGRERESRTESSQPASPRIISTFIPSLGHRFYEWAQQNSNKMNEFYGKTFASQLSYDYYY